MPNSPNADNNLQKDLDNTFSLNPTVNDNLWCIYSNLLAEFGEPTSLLPSPMLSITTTPASQNASTSQFVILGSAKQWVNSCEY